MTGLYRLSTTATGTALFTKILYVRFFNVGLVPMGFSKFHLVNLYEELESDIHLKGQLLVGLQIHEGRKTKLQIRSTTVEDSFVLNLQHKL